MSDNCCNSKLSIPSEKFNDCCEVFFSSCIAYNGDEGCLDFGTFPSMNDVIARIIDELCALNHYDDSCLVAKGYKIGSLREWTKAITDVVCQILGCQVPQIGEQQGSITSLCEINDRLNLQTVLSCFRSIAMLGEQATLEQLLTALQQTVCALVNAPKPLDEKTKVSATDSTSGYLMQKLKSSNSIAIQLMNAGADEYLRANLRLDPASTIVVPMSITNDGLLLDFKIDPDSTAPVSITDKGLRVDCCDIEIPPPPVVDAALNCAGITNDMVLPAAGSVTGTITVPYTCTVSGNYPAITIPSNELVNGAPVAFITAPASSFGTPGGNIVFTATGNTTGFNGNSVSFIISINGTTCTVTIPYERPTLYQADCATWFMVADTLYIGRPISYSGGSPYIQFQVICTQLGLTGSTITIDQTTAGGITAGPVNNFTLSLGGNLIPIPVSGTPNAANISLPIKINGVVVCTLELTASTPPEVPGSYDFYCSGDTCKKPTFPDGAEGIYYSESAAICYVNGNNGLVSGSNITGYWYGSIIPSGLTLSIPPITISAPTGTITVTVVGTPVNAPSSNNQVVFTLPGSRCDLVINIAPAPRELEVENLKSNGDTYTEKVKFTFGVFWDQVGGGNAALDDVHRQYYQSFPGYIATSPHSVKLAHTTVAAAQTFKFIYGETYAPSSFLEYLYAVKFYLYDANSILLNTGVVQYSQMAPLPSTSYMINGTLHYIWYEYTISIPSGTSRITFEPIISNA